MTARLRRRVRWWLVALGLAGCLESPGGPARFGELRIQAEFTPGEEPSALGITVDSTLVIATRQGGAGTVVDTALGPGAESLEHAWIVDLEAGEELLRVDLELRGHGTRLYAGGADVTVVEGEIATDVVTAVPVSYVGPPPVAQVIVTPATATLDALGATLAFSAQALDAGGVPVTGSSFTWTSADPTVATVDPASGVATAVGNGSTMISASSGGRSGSATLTVAQVVTSVVVSPATATLTTPGAAQQFTAAVLDAGGSAVAGASVAWGSSDPQVATIDPATGVATAIGQGTVTIGAASTGVTGTATLTVSLGSNIASVTVLPASVTLTALGATQQFTAEVRDANGTLLPGVPVSWNSTDRLTATIDPVTGLATATGHGTTTITATAGGTTGTATLAVALTGGAQTVTVLPASATLTALGATQQFIAEVRDASGTLLPGVPVSWSSSDALVATIDPVTGLATATGHGSTTITATAGSTSGTATLDVTLTGSTQTVTVLPASATLTALGATQQFTAEVRDANGALLPGVPVSWSSSDALAATIDPATGLATATGHGGSTITATAGGTSGTASLTVTLTGGAQTVTVLPASATLTALGATQQFTAEVRDANGALLPGAPVSWTSADPLVATIDPATGLATTTGHGSSTITAMAGGTSGTATLAVILTGGAQTVTVLPASATLTALGATQQFTAEVRDANGALLPGVPVSWSSTDPLVATIDPTTGLATATGHGSSAITATAGSTTGTATLAVTLTGAAQTVTVLPGSATLTALGATQQFTAEVRDANGTLLPGVPVSWTSTDPLVATIDPVTGLATATGHGPTTITATTGGTSGSATLTIDLAPSVASVTVLPATATLTSLGATQQFSAEVRDASGNLLAGVPVAWSSSNPLTASIDPVTGLATARDGGTATITAAAGGVTGSAQLIVDR